MPLNRQRVGQLLKQFDFKTLFVEDMGWDRFNARPIDLLIEDKQYRLEPIAEKGGMAVFLCRSTGSDSIPSGDIRRKIENKIKGSYYEHLLLFADPGNTRCVWLWAKREAGQPVRYREHTFHHQQTGEGLIQKLEAMNFDFDDLDKFGNVKITEVVSRVARAFDVERVTKRFYEHYRTEHETFRDFLGGIESTDDRAWYASVMLNRLMFIYFIQKKAFLDSNVNYLSDRLGDSIQRRTDTFYRDFLIPLFFQGFALEEKDRPPEVRRLLGRIPYLNGGLFTKHQLEERYGEKIQIPDAAFKGLFTFFDRYTWHLDDRPLRADYEINPDVLGYVYEKYVNQKQMGAYYTKEDITDYICKNTIVPFLFDKLASLRPEALEPFPMDNVEPYIYDAVKTDSYLPTETEREYKARRKRHDEIKADFQAGKIKNINDLITYNLDIRRFAEEWARQVNDPMTLRLFYFDILSKVTVLDPTCGSGAFLFAALNILESLYEICLDRMAALLNLPNQRQRQEMAGKYPDFTKELKRVSDHPSRKYFVYKSIIINNLYGVDIMEEATEICKLRMFLKLVAQIDDVGRIEPLPDIDFNIRAGNTLVGYASLAEVEQAAKRSLFNLNLPQKMREADAALRAFRELQMRAGIGAHELAKVKTDTRAKLTEIEDELNEALRVEYGATNLKSFVKSHQPFHWYVGFHDIMQGGGFDVVVGNPPYVDYNKVKDQYQVRGYRTEACGNLYALVLERSLHVCRADGRLGMIVPLSVTFSQDFVELRSQLRSMGTSWFSSYDNIPAAVFEGVSQRCTIWLGARSEERATYVTTMYRWRADYRPCLTNCLNYTLFIGADTSAFGIPKLVGSHQVQLMQMLSAASSQRGVPSRISGDAQVRLGFSQTARNFVSVFLDTPPCLDAASLRLVPQSKVTFLTWPLPTTEYAALAMLAGEVYFWYWLTRGDGFDVTSWIVQDFLSCGASLLDIDSSRLLDGLGRLLHNRRFESLVFKKNAGKYVGNYNYHGQFGITRRADLLLLSRLKASKDQAGDVLNFVQRVLSINAYAGEKSIPDEVRALFRPHRVDRVAERRLFNETDTVLMRYYGFTEEELDFIINYDIKYRMGADAVE